MTTTMTGVTKSSATTLSPLSRNASTMTGATRNTSLALLITQAGDFLMTQADDFLATGVSNFDALAKS